MVKSHKQELVRLSGEITKKEGIIVKEKEIIDALRNDLSAAKEEQTAAHGRKGELDALNQEIGAISSKKGLYTEIEELRTELDTLKQNRDELVQTRDETRQKKKDFDTAVSDKRNFQSQNEHVGELIGRHENAKNQLISLKSKCDDYLKEEINNDKLRQDAEKANAELECGRQRFSTMRKEYNASFAGRIAQAHSSS